MDRQFADRRAYYDSRAMSRIGQTLGGEKCICLILDSMDHSKWSIPRSSSLKAKCFSGLNRPHLDCTGVIIHGHLVGVYFAEPSVVKGGSWTADIIAHVLSKLVASGIDLRAYHCHIQSDNCSKERKNNVIARMLSLLVSKRRVLSASMQNCITGHSHEDIDQFFSLLGSFLQTQAELHDPSQFLNAVRTYLANPAVRHREQLREVVRLDQCRDWNPAIVILSQPLKGSEGVSKTNSYNHCVSRII